MTPVGQQVVVQKEDQMVVDVAQLTFHVGHRARLVIRRPPEAALVTEIARMRTAARRDHRVSNEIGPRIHQVAAGNRHQSGRAFAAPSIELLQPPVLEVVENLAPNRLGRANAHGIGVFGGLIGQARRMQSAEHNLGAAPLPALGQFIGPAGRRNVRLDSHHIHVAFHLGGFDMLVAYGDVPAIGRQSGDRHEAQRRELGVLDQPEMFIARPDNAARISKSRRFMAIPPAKYFALQSTRPK